MNKKDINEVYDKLQKIESFKNINMSYNEEKNIFDIYAKVRKSEEETKDIFNDIKELEYEYCDFGIFEFWFTPEDTEKVLKILNSKF